MCGRFALNRGLGQLRQRLAVEQIQSNGRTFDPSNNIAPTNVIPVMANSAIELLVWGVQRGEHLVINARSETLVQKFGKDARDRRCLVPADGYFEWTKEKQPYFFKQHPEELMFFAGIYTQSGHVIILTRAASDSLTWIHSRMPLILTGTEISAWQSSDWIHVLEGVPPVLTWYPVARAALAASSKGEECIKQITIKKNTQRTLDSMLKSETKAKIQELL
jgi:putative SOS response-associated peptidase YedK